MIPHEDLNLFFLLWCEVVEVDCNLCFAVALCAEATERQLGLKILHRSLLIVIDTITVLVSK